MPTNSKVRNDVRRRSLDQVEESLLPPTTSTVDESTVPPVVPTITTPQFESYNDVLKLSDIFQNSEQEHAKAKRDTVPKYMADPGRLNFKPDPRDDEELEVAETHLFRPLFKYQSLDSKRRHIRRQSTTSTTTRRN